MNKIISRTNTISVNEKHFMAQENLSELKKFVKSIDSQIKILPKTSSPKVFVKSTPSMFSMGNLSVNKPQQCFLLKRNTQFDPNLYKTQKSFVQTKTNSETHPFDANEGKNCIQTTTQPLKPWTPLSRNFKREHHLLFFKIR